MGSKGPELVYDNFQDDKIILTDVVWLVFKLESRVINNRRSKICLKYNEDFIA